MVVWVAVAVLLAVLFELPNNDVHMSENVNFFVTLHDISCAILKPSKKWNSNSSKEVRPMGSETQTSRRLVLLDSVVSSK